jgi:hypothetical protein
MRPYWSVAALALLLPCTCVSSLAQEGATASLIGEEGKQGKRTFMPWIHRRERKRCQNGDFVPEHSTAVWTMLTEGDSYVAGAVVMGLSVKQHSTVPLDLVVMELATKPLADVAWVRLQEVGWKRCVVDRITPLAKTFPRFRDQFTKLHLWGMTMYKTILYLDSDTLAVNSIDGLLLSDLGDRDIGVARDIRGGKWCDTFNMGVFLINPDEHEYQRLLQLQNSNSVKYESNMAEQGWINVVYKDKWYDIGFTNNANLAAYSDGKYDRPSSMWAEKSDDIRVIHYTMNKPWECHQTYKSVCRIWLQAYAKQEASSLANVRSKLAWKFRTEVVLSCLASVCCAILYKVVKPRWNAGRPKELSGKA